MPKENTTIQMFADYEGDISTIFKEGKECDCPILTTRNMVVMPGILVPILLGRQRKSIFRYSSWNVLRVQVQDCRKAPPKRFRL